MKTMKNYDFSGWATRNDLRCSDGRIIRRDAFKANDGQKVPLVWNHMHYDTSNVLGHALLENRSEGVYAYCYFNGTDKGQEAKELVKHGDILALSIYANQLKQNGSDVIHGAIKEVSLVLAGANPGAMIDSVIEHGELLDEEAIIYTGSPIDLIHSEEESEENIEEVEEAEEIEEVYEAEESEKKEEEIEENMPNEELEHAESEETIQDIIDSMNEKQKKVLYALVGSAISDKAKEDGGEEMKHNAFYDDEMNEENVLTHADMSEILADAKRLGSLKDAFLAHSDDENSLPEYGIEHIDYLFPDARNINNVPDFIKREDAWVPKVMNGTHHTPFSRVKSIHANITMDEARAKGYIKGNEKKEEVFTLLKRSTTPQTIYKKQKLDRDDVIDITDLDVVAWLKSEMRMMLDEEIARAILVGDGRSNADDDKIDESHIRPIWTDDDLYTIKKKVDFTGALTDEAKAKLVIKAAIKARKDYKGTGNPTFFTTEDMLTNMLLIEDTTGRIIYDSEAKLATALRVKEIVTVPVMEDLSREVSGDDYDLLGIIVNLADYNVGADKGGAVNMFDDFDIDFNQQKYLIETRCSGALVKPYSAIVLETESQGE